MGPESADILGRPWSITMTSQFLNTACVADACSLLAVRTSLVGQVSHKAETRSDFFLLTLRALGSIRTNADGH